MIEFENRASTVLYNALRSLRTTGPFLLPANICPIIPLVFLKAGRAFEFIDIDPESLCIDQHAVMARWRVPADPPAGIVYVRTYGAIFDATELFAGIKATDSAALIIDDRCLAMPDCRESLAAFVDIALYSTGYAKSADLGFGGFGVMRDGVRYERADLPYHRGDLEVITAQYKDALTTGKQFIYRDCNWLDTCAPTLRWSQYRQVVETTTEQALALKSTINDHYAKHLPVDVQFPDPFQTWRFNVRVRNKAEILKAIHRGGLFASGHYDSLTNIFGCGNAPVAAQLHAQVINLFNDHYFDIDRADRIVNLLQGLDVMAPDQVLS